MKKLQLSIVAGEPPPHQSFIAQMDSELKSLTRKISGFCTGAAIVGLIGLAGLEFKWTSSAMWHGAMTLAYATGLAAFLIGRAYQNVINQRIREISPINDSLLAEAATLANASTTASEYVAALRLQKRELTLIELMALRDLAARTPVNQARAALYG